MSNTQSKIFFSRGKLLLSGEYLVMKGAKALAVPLITGQTLVISANPEPFLIWETYEFNQLVFKAKFTSDSIAIMETTNQEKALYIQKLLKAAIALNTDFLREINAKLAVAKIGFPMHYGWGTSSTLIANIAQWANCNPYHLLWNISKGSGYDIACAQADSPIFYQNINKKILVEPVVFNPPFTDQLALVYLNRKASTEPLIAEFSADTSDYNRPIDQVSLIAEKMVEAANLQTFMKLMDEHETLVSGVLNTSTVKQKLFSDFNGSIKSLGAWGGDFILVASPMKYGDVKNYFVQKGFVVVFPFKQVIL